MLNFAVQDILRKRKPTLGKGNLNLGFAFLTNILGNKISKKFKIFGWPEHGT
jgi:hypothetical protein